jgi:integrase
MAKLSDTKIRNAKPRKKAFKLYDEGGLYLIVKPSGARWWRVRYHWRGKEQLLSVGVYPEVSLATARERCADTHKLVANGINPSSHRQQKKVAERESSERTYEAIAKQWLELTGKAREWTADHIERVHRRQEVHAWPWIGVKPIAEVTDADVLACLKRVVDRGLLDTAHRLRADTHAIFAYAKKWKLVPHNPVADLRDSDTLPKLKVTHNAAITDPRAFGVLLRALDTYPGSFVVRCALKLQALVFVRPGELRAAVWSEFDLANAEWRIPAARMKMGEQHIVPLARQALEILRELHPFTGPDGFVFPQARSPSRPISGNTLGAALRTLGFSADQHSAHGFRSTASTLLNESGMWHPDAIERQLAHGERNKVRVAYNSAQHLVERRKMMQAWADYLDALKAGGNVVPIRRATA